MAERKSISTVHVFWKEQEGAPGGWYIETRQCLQRSRWRFAAARLGWTSPKELSEARRRETLCPFAALGARGTRSHAPLGKSLIQQPAQLMWIKLSRALAQSVLRVYHDHIGKLHLLHLFVEDQDRNMLSSDVLVQHGAQGL